MKRNTLIKFKGITFPIFTLLRKPYKIVYSLHKISGQLYPDSHLQTIDNKLLNGDYFSRLLQLEHRISFDSTCRNVQDLIFTKSSWGIDSKAIPHNFSTLHAVPVEKRQVVKVVGNLFWLRNISYPFEIATQENISLADPVYATIVFVNGEWFLREFSYDSNLERPYVYV